MGKLNVRLNPTIEGGINRELLPRTIGLLQHILPNIPEPQKRGKGRLLQCSASFTKRNYRLIQKREREEPKDNNRNFGVTRSTQQEHF